MIILRIFVFIYGLLTMLAIGEQIMATGFQWGHIFYFLFGGILMFVAFRPSMTALMYVGMIGLLIFVIIYGYMTNTLAWSHILVRTIITLAVILFWRHYF